MAKTKKKTTPKKGSARKSTSRPKPRSTKSSERDRTSIGSPFRTLTPYLAVNDARKAIDWYRQTLGAKEVSRMNTPDGKILHCELLVGDSRFMLSDIFPGADFVDPKLVGSCVTIHVHAKNIDELYHRAVENGAQVTMPLENQFWGDRYGKIRDPFGHVWSFGYPAKMSKQERDAKAKAAMATFSADAQM